jgi:NAD(P)-dependent dehydrogenase (short-subunit alcohol dehydrogenase family)
MFDATSTTDDVLAGIDLTGRRFLVTGASGGLGLETTRALAAHGATVVMAARNREKNQAAADVVRAGVTGATVSLLDVDLASLASVRAAAAEVLGSGEPLHGLIANAGVMATPEGRTVDGFETQFGVNHLGHFLLTTLLADLLVASAPARVVVLTSAGHRMGDLDLDDVNFERRPYDPFEAYGAAKTANVLHAVEFDRRHRDRGVRAFAVHPGGIHTELGRYMEREVLARLIEMMATAEVRWKTVEQGAATAVWAATSPDLDGEGGRYCEDCRISPVLHDDQGDQLQVNDVGVLARAVDRDRARRLWAMSEQLVGLAP